MDALHDIDRARRALVQLRVKERNPEPELTIVWDEELEAAIWAVGDQEIGAAARHGRPVRVIAVGTRMLEVLGSIDRLLADRAVHD